MPPLSLPTERTAQPFDQAITLSYVNDNEYTRSNDTISFLGIEFENVDMQQALRRCEQLVDSNDFHYVTTPNVDHVVTMHSEQVHAKTFRQAEVAATMRLCDSRIIALLARLSGVRLPTVPGSDLTAELMRKVIRPGHRVAIVGGDEALLQKLREQRPNVTFLHHVPPMGVLHDERAQDDICRFVEAARADFIFLAIGAPQSEVVARAIARCGKARGVGLCVGASLAFFTGQLRRAPRALQVLHLEWLFRLLSEPRRLWRRYVLKGPRIFHIWWKYRLADRLPAPAF